MNKQVIAISVNKVQTFLFDTILSHTQEMQTEENTLKSIMMASKEISDDFVQKINIVFSGIIVKKLLECSGVYIFECELQSDYIEQRLNQLFQSYYKESQGKKQLRYVYFLKENLSDLEAIKEAKQLLVKPETIATIIEKNRELLFSFQIVIDDNQKSNKSVINLNKYPKFARDVNALSQSTEIDNSNHFRMAVIKADLDGMGDMFKNIDNYDDYQAISSVLNQFVSLDGLHQVALEDFPKQKNGWIFPFYAAGDDIFFAVAIENLISGIELCRIMISKINIEISKVTSNHNLTLSIGVEISFNREPVRYYMNMVENQLKCAKSMQVQRELKRFVRSKISMAGVQWLDVDIKKINAHKERLRGKEKHKQGCKCKQCTKILKINRALGSTAIWRFFLDEVAILSRVKRDKKLGEFVGTTHSYYFLLEKLMEKNIHNDDKKYINNLLYHLLPKYLDTSIKEDLWKVELQINRGIIKQLYQKGSGGNYIQVSNEMKKRLEGYLRMMILFSDKRFKINGIDMNKGYSFGKSEQENVRKELLNKPMEYLYMLLKDEHGKELIKYFANYKKAGRKGNHLERISMDKSMFFKLRRTNKVNIGKAAAMIALQNTDTKEDINKKNKIREENKKKPLYMYFDKEGFEKAAKNSHQWTADFIDSLMLLYEYNTLLRKYKTRCRDMKGRSS